MEKCKQVVEEIYNQFDASHDFAHIERVLKNADAILKKKNPLIQKLSDLRSCCMISTMPNIKQAIIRLPPKFYIQLKRNLDLSQQVLACIESVSFSGGNAKAITSIEGAIVRDADRLDAIGAIGIARTFAFGGARGRKLYDAGELARENMSEAEYRSKETASVTHFYEKLLLLKELMVTEEGKRLARQRHAFMEAFLKQLDSEIGSGER